MNDAGRVDVFQTSQDLVKEVLDELLLERSGGKETVKISTEEFGHEIAGPMLAEAVSG